MMRLAPESYLLGHEPAAGTGEKSPFAIIKRNEIKGKQVTGFFKRKGCMYTCKVQVCLRVRDRKMSCGLSVCILLENDKTPLKKSKKH